MKVGEFSASGVRLPVVSHEAPRRQWSHDHDEPQVPSPREVAVASRIQRPGRRRMLSLTVQGSEQPSPHFMTVTLGGEDVQYLERAGFDQAGRLFFADPDDDAAEVFLPSSERWILQLTLQGSKQRPRVRTYSIRRFRPKASAFDIEISLHAADSPGAAGWGTRWARAAEPGTTVAFLDEGHSYAPAPGAETR
ncbi:siderophore-interacting protein [Kitasatospora sp. NPDC094019]|uniref:siderophore-interacting protein n=1 Tax=Kitasatospora sp. NPDC094019 TaxID=3364091 RepID=UPI003817DB52